MKRIRSPMSKEGSKLIVVEEEGVLPWRKTLGGCCRRGNIVRGKRKCTFDWASAIAAMMMPVVSIATLKTALWLGQLAQ